MDGSTAFVSECVFGSIEQLRLILIFLVTFALFLNKSGVAVFWRPIPCTADGGSSSVKNPDRLSEWPTSSSGRYDGAPQWNP